MDTISAPAEQLPTNPLTEVTQISVAHDDDVSAVNALLSDGWKLLHVGHTHEYTVYVLGKTAAPSKRRTGFTS